MSAVLEPGELQAIEKLPTAIEPAGIMLVISRAAADPNTDVTKLERLLQMYERLEASAAKTAYAAALARLQPKLPILSERGGIKDRAGNVQSKYALWEDIVGAITPLLSSEGFALSFRTESTLTEGITVTAVLTHSGGHSEATSLTLPTDTSGSKNAVQAVGSSVSYGKRYTCGALLNLRTGETDDDGKTGGGGAPQALSEKQVADLEALISEVGADKKRLLKYLKVDSLEEILATNYESVVQTIQLKRK